MWPIRSIIRPLRTAPTVNPAKKLLSTRPAKVVSKPSSATRREMKVPKNPFASWTPLVAMMRVPICACIDPLDRIGLS